MGCEGKGREKVRIEGKGKEIVIIEGRGRRKSDFGRSKGGREGEM